MDVVDVGRSRRPRGRSRRWFRSLAALDSAAGHPHREAPGIVIAAVALLVERRAAEFAAPHHQRVVEQPARFQVGRAGRRSACRRPAHLRVVAFDVGVRVPAAAAAANTARRTVRRAPPAAAPAGNSCRTSAVASSSMPYSFLVASDSFVRSTASGRGRLHPIGQFVGVDARFEFGVVRLVAPKCSVQRLQQDRAGCAAVRRSMRVRRRQIENRRALVAELRALIGRRQKSGAPVLRAADDFARRRSERRTSADSRFAVPSP